MEKYLCTKSTKHYEEYARERKNIKKIIKDEKQ